ncbi:hypothetical protein BsWGS_20508 [Bradybaena similaris]
MCHADKHRWSWFTISHDNQSHGSSVCSCLNYTMQTTHPGIYLFVFHFSLNLPVVTKFSSLFLMTCPKNFDCPCLLSLINLRFPCCCLLSSSIGVETFKPQVMELRPSSYQ